MITLNILLLIWLIASLLIAGRAKEKEGIKGGLYSNNVMAELPSVAIVGMYIPWVIFLGELFVLFITVMP